MAVVGSGPNGLSAAIVLAKAGYPVDVFEAQQVPGGAVRTLPLTEPGFLHDFGSAVHPMAAASPFFRSIDLESHGLEWIHSPVVLAHPLDGGEAVCLYRDIAETAAQLGSDGHGWKNLMTTFVDHWGDIDQEVLRPVNPFTAHPFLMAKFALRAIPSARSIVARYFREGRASALFAGLAAHSFLSLDEPFSASFGLVLGIVGHVAGWPIPRSGSQSITNALLNVLHAHGGEVNCGHRVDSLEELGEYDLKLCDVTPRQLARLAGSKLAEREREALRQFRYGPSVFKVDYALSSPVPWAAPECRRSATVHVCGSYEEVLASEKAMSEGKHSDRPFVLVAQPSLFDSTRAPEGKHVLWAYCHVPHGSDRDMLPILEAQIERFATGFRDCIEARRVFRPSDLEAMDENLVGGDITGGLLNLRQFLFRPTSRLYRTTAPDVFIASSSTPPGGGVHGMCGYHAARAALKSLRT